ncbi:hypothetical protein ACFWBX_27920 [Streptomyces sp. NPDC059991]|uniref:hypothetical protein n=1 Tax=Streptomyces sp. NPDC059991 TaxID=3347028 RepID=UPI0036BA91FB
MATKRVPARTKAVDKCGPCKGTGEVPKTVKVGRKQRVVGAQSGICLNCFGTGHAPTT